MHNSWKQRVENCEAFFNFDHENARSYRLCICEPYKGFQKKNFSKTPVYNTSYLTLTQKLKCTEVDWTQDKSVISTKTRKHKYAKTKEKKTRNRNVYAETISQLKDCVFFCRVNRCYARIFHCIHFLGLKNFQTKPLLAGLISLREKIQEMAFGGIERPNLCSKNQKTEQKNANV